MIGKGRQRGGSSAGDRQSWRTLASKKKSRRMKSHQSRRRRKRQILKVAGLAIAVSLFFLAIVWTIHQLRIREEPTFVATPSDSIRRILFETDGVLPNTWLSQAIGLTPGMTLMEVDIFAMKARLESYGQVVSASVTRAFPDELQITIVEKQPLLRIRTVDQNGAIETQIVGRDGTIYRGFGYSSVDLGALPYLNPFRRSGGSIEPIVGIDTVNKLVDVVRYSQPAFFESWVVLDLTNFSGEREDPGQVIVVETSLVPKIVFGIDMNFDVQLDRLGVILNFIEEQENVEVAQVDLSLDDSAAVQFVDGKNGQF